MAVFRREKTHFCTIIDNLEVANRKDKLKGLPPEVRAYLRKPSQLEIVQGFCIEPDRLVMRSFINYYCLNLTGLKLCIVFTMKPVIWVGTDVWSSSNRGSTSLEW